MENSTKSELQRSLWQTTATHNNKQSPKLCNQQILSLVKDNSVEACQGAIQRATATTIGETGYGFVLHLLRYSSLLL